MDQRESNLNDSGKVEKDYRKSHHPTTRNDIERPSAIQRQLLANGNGEDAPGIYEPGFPPDKRWSVLPMVFCLVLLGVALVGFRSERLGLLWSPMGHSVGQASPADTVVRPGATPAPAVLARETGNTGTGKERDSKTEASKTEASETTTGDSSHSEDSIAAAAQSLSVDEVQRLISAGLEAINKADPEVRQRLTEELLAAVLPEVQGKKVSAGARNYPGHDVELLSMASGPQDTVGVAANLPVENSSPKTDSAVVSAGQSVDGNKADSFQAASSGPQIDQLQIIPGELIDKHFIPDREGSVLMVSFAYSHFLLPDEAVSSSRLVIKIRSGERHPRETQQVISLPGERGTSSVAINTGVSGLESGKSYVDFFYKGELIANTIFDY